MILDVPYKFLDLEPSQELLNFDFGTITDEAWNRHNSLKFKFPTIFGEVETFRISFLDSTVWGDPKNHNPIPENTDHPVRELIVNELSKLEEYYNSTVKIAVLDRLPPGARINRHFDQSPIYEKCHRIHLPLITNDLVDFYIADVKYNFKAGQFFEFNNRAYHEVHNNSNLHRIHLVVDLLPNG